MLILESPWTRQPQGAVGVDWAKSLTAGLQLCISPGVTGSTNVAIEFVSGRALAAYTTGRSLVVSADGRGYSQPAASNAPAFALLPNVSADKQTTASFLSSFTFNFQRGLVFDLGRGHLAFNTSGQLGVATGAGGINAGATPYTVPAGRGVYVATYESGSAKLYADGVLKSTVAGVDVTGMTTPVNIGGETTGGYNASAWTCLISCAWNRILSAQEVFNFSMNPWQLFAPQQIILPTPAAAGYTHPTLSAATATEITATSFKPRVTYTFA